MKPRERSKQTTRICCAQFFSDGFFISPTDEFLANRLETNGKSADTFVYLFSHGGAVSTLDLFPALGLPKVDLDQDLGNIIFLINLYILYSCDN